MNGRVALNYLFTTMIGKVHDFDVFLLLKAGVANPKPLGDSQR